MSVHITALANVAEMNHFCDAETVPRATRLLLCSCTGTTILLAGPFSMTDDNLAGLDPSSVRATLLAAAEAAAERTLAGFRTPLAVENKWQTGFDPVTAADKDAEIAVRSVIGERFTSEPETR